MSFSVTYGDALEYKGDAVLNSLGTNGAVYGKLCKNIINGINRKEVKALIDSQKNMPFGKIIETDGGDLKCAHVLHLVTPFKKNDDGKCTALRNAYKAVVDYAIVHGYKKIGLPLIGTGANGYSDKQAYEAVIDVLSEISDREETENIDIIEATVIAYLNPKPMKKVVEDYCEVPYRRAQSYTIRSVCDEETCFSAVHNEEFLKEIEDEHSFYNVAMFMGDINPADLFYPQFMPGKTAYVRPYDFVDDYCTQKKLPVKTLREYDSRKRQDIRNNKTLSKIDVFRFSVLLNLTKTEILQFMALCGWGFNPTSRLDMFFMDYINGKYCIFGKQRKLYELDMWFNPADNECQFTIR